MSPIRSQHRRSRANPAMRSLRDALLLIAVVAIGLTVDVSLDRPARAEVDPRPEPSVERALRWVEWPEATPPDVAGTPTAEHDRDAPVAPALERRRSTIRTATSHRTI